MNSGEKESQTHADRILAELHGLPDGASDAQLAQHLVLRHQTVNAVCRTLMQQGRVSRTRHGGPIINRVPGNPDYEYASNPLDKPDEVPLIRSDKPWFWEGHIQARVVAFLARGGWTIVRVADTASKERGKDIEAERDGAQLWITVKGRPAGTPKTHPSVQAGHWFAGALLDVIMWRQEGPDVQLGVALPNYTRYESLAKRTRWLQEATPFTYFWVPESGEVQSTLSAAATD